MHKVMVFFSFFSLANISIAAVNYGGMSNIPAPDFSSAAQMASFGNQSLQSGMTQFSNAVSNYAEARAQKERYEAELRVQKERYEDAIRAQREKYNADSIVENRYIVDHNRMAIDMIIRRGGAIKMPEQDSKIFIITESNGEVLNCYKLITKDDCWRVSSP